MQHPLLYLNINCYYYRYCCYYYCFYCYYYCYYYCLSLSYFLLIYYRRFPQSFKHQNFPQVFFFFSRYQSFYGSEFGLVGIFYHYYCYLIGHFDCICYFNLHLTWLCWLFRVINGHFNLRKQIFDWFFKTFEFEVIFLVFFLL